MIRIEDNKSVWGLCINTEINDTEINVYFTDETGDEIASICIDTEGWVEQENLTEYDWDYVMHEKIAGTMEEELEEQGYEFESDEEGLILNALEDFVDKMLED